MDYVALINTTKLSLSWLQCCYLQCSIFFRSQNIGPLQTMQFLSWTFYMKCSIMEYVLPSGPPVLKQKYVVA
jgi:hypothetical protein